MTMLKDGSKQRLVFLDDSRWKSIKTTAIQRDMTISALIAEIVDNYFVADSDH